MVGACSCQDPVAHTPGTVLPFRGGSFCSSRLLLALNLDELDRRSFFTMGGALTSTLVLLEPAEDWETTRLFFLLGICFKQSTQHTRSAPCGCRRCRSTMEGLPRAQPPSPPTLPGSCPAVGRCQRTDILPSGPKGVHLLPAGKGVRIGTHIRDLSLGRGQAALMECRG